MSMSRRILAATAALDRKSTAYFRPTPSISDATTGRVCAGPLSVTVTLIARTPAMKPPQNVVINVLLNHYAERGLLRILDTALHIATWQHALKHYFRSSFYYRHNIRQGITLPFNRHTSWKN